MPSEYLGHWIVFSAGTIHFGKRASFLHVFSGTCSSHILFLLYPHLSLSSAFISYQLIHRSLLTHISHLYNLIKSSQCLSSVGMTSQQTLSFQPSWTNWGKTEQSPKHLENKQSLPRAIRYFINDKDQIRKISDPEQEFQFKINKNPRWNERQREVMNGMLRTSPPWFRLVDDNILTKKARRT